MKISLTSVPIDDVDKAFRFYTQVLGFAARRDIPLPNGDRWVTVVSPEQPDGPELLLEPNGSYAAMKALKESLVKDGIPFTTFETGDVRAEYERLRKLGVKFVMEPTDMGPTMAAVLDDTCGNLIQIFQVKRG